ncbi:hypothetical protein [Azospirillum doebereinerae]|uniref:hypothetical protein n=1 Tax=Azospirillum doebereinerae TaxID=92933 RepID=UPI001EE50D07|nr:hypothetical protein [Azospirillum doebereinerae]MCG5238982.1 hypothetical protein [Azospirillum doebereinerae]
MIRDPQGGQDDRIPELYADGILDVGFGNGMVRIDLFSLSPLRKDENGQPLPAIRQRVVMSLQGFLSSLGAMDGMRQRLEAAGILVPNGVPNVAPADAAPRPPGPFAVAAPTAAMTGGSLPSPVAAPAPSMPVPPKSPNFG